jgi:hypothetical protein
MFFQFGVSQTDIMKDFGHTIHQNSHAHPSVEYLLFGQEERAWLKISEKKTHVNHGMVHIKSVKSERFDGFPPIDRVIQRRKYMLEDVAPSD